MSEEKVDKMISEEEEAGLFDINTYKQLNLQRKKITIQCARCESEGEIPRDFIRFEEHSDDEYAYHLKKFFKGKLN